MKIKEVNIILTLFMIVFKMTCQHENSEIAADRINFFQNRNLNNLLAKKNIVYLAVLGSGPAGLSAGLYGARAGIHTVIFQGPKPQGQLVDGILVENWPGVDKGPGVKVMAKLENQVRNFGAHIFPDTIKKVDFSSWPFKLWGQDRLYYALSIVIATGAVPRRLNIKGESKYWIKGILSCGLCDAQLAKNQEVVIIGGGDAAMERILQLIPYASSIKVIIRDNKLKASKRMKRKIKEFENVSILYNKEVTEFVGNGKSLRGINIYDNASGRKSFIPAKWAFLAIGFEPNTNLFKNQLPIGKHGYISHDGLQNTIIPGIYVAGNVSDNRYRQASTASGDATKAALNAINFVRSLEIDKQLKLQLNQQIFVPPTDIFSKNIQTEDIKIQNLKTESELIRYLKSGTPHLIYFYSSMCATCKLMQPIVAQISKMLKNKISVHKVDISQAESLNKKFDIRTVPTFVILSNKKEVARLTGQKSTSELIEFVKKALK